jgi:hypothetical protein
MAVGISHTSGAGSTTGAAADRIFTDRRDKSDRRSRRGGGNSHQESGAFVTCRRDHDNDRRGRNPLIPNGCWWLQRNYLDWESNGAKSPEGAASKDA